MKAVGTEYHPLAAAALTAAVVLLLVSLAAAALTAAVVLLLFVLLCVLCQALQDPSSRCLPPPFLHTQTVSTTQYQQLSADTPSG
jgi:hypothetical protein